MRPRNPDFIDRYLDLERKLRRNRNAPRFGEWYDLEPHLSVTSPEVIPTGEGFGVRVEGDEGNLIVEFRGGVQYLTDGSTASIFDTKLPALFIPEGDWRDVWGFIDFDVVNASYQPAAGGWSFNIGGQARVGLGQDGHLTSDGATVVLNTTGGTPALAYATAPSAFGHPMSGTVVNFNGASYPISLM